MNILITINKGYVKQLNVLLNSIQYSNSKEKFDVYILHKNLEQSDIENIQGGLDLEKIFIHEIKISKSEIDNFPVYEKRYPVEIYFRIFATKYLPTDLDKVLYLDADTIVINELKELYETDFCGNYFIATTHIRKLLHRFNEIRLDIKEDEPYINTGVLLINLKELRKRNVEKEVMEYIENNKKILMLPDQDIISSIYGNKIKLVDGLKYNLGDRSLNTYNLRNPKNQINLKWVCKNTVVIHYYGRNKPWQKDYVGKLGCFYKKIEKKMKKNENKYKKVLILSCGTGGGHNSAAKAVQEEFLNKGVQADFSEYLDIVNPKLKDKVNNLYLSSTNGEGQVFKHVYHLGEMYQKTKLRSPVYAINSLSKKKLYEYIKENGYEYIITTHVFAAQALTAIKKEYDIHFMSIATDYVCIPFFEETEADYTVIPHKELEEGFISKGFKKEKLLPIGIPVAPRYSKKYDKTQCKKELGLKEDKKYVLILNGSMGFGNVESILKKLTSEIKDVNFIVACGNNEKLLKRLEEKYCKNDNVINLPYTNNLNKYMASSELILTKPGGLTTTEIATMRKPLIHIMPIPGCENYNATFFADKKMSIKCDNIEEVVSATKEVLQNKEFQKEMIQSQEKYINSNACEQIVNFVIEKLEKEKCYERIRR